MSLRRNKPLRRTGGLRRGKPLPRVNAQRAAKRRAEHFGRQAELCRELPCCVCAGPLTYFAAMSDLAEGHEYLGAPFGSDPHHVRSRGAGGTDRDCVPLCREHHTEIHQLGRESFEKKHDINLRSTADALHNALSRPEADP